MPSQRLASNYVSEINPTDNFNAASITAHHRRTGFHWHFRCQWKTLKTWTWVTRMRLRMRMASMWSIWEEYEDESMDVCMRRPIFLPIVGPAERKYNGGGDSKIACERKEFCNRISGTRCEGGGTGYDTAMTLWTYNRDYCKLLTLHRWRNPIAYIEFDLEFRLLKDLQVDEFQRSLSWRSPLKK